MARRLRKEVLTRADDGSLAPSKEVRWSWDGHNPLVELDSEEGKSTWVFEPETFSPLAKLATGRVWGALLDQIGAPTELRGEDGSIARRLEIDSYGGVSVLEGGGPSLPLMGPGQYRDDETGLVFNVNRYLDPTSGSYVSPDPIRLWGGTRPYGFVLDPTIAFDPLGLDVCHHRGSGDDLVRRLEQELDDAVRHADNMLAAGLTGGTTWGRLYQHVFKGTPLARMARGNAVQQIAEGIVQRGSAVRHITAAGGKVLFNEGSAAGLRSSRGRLLRPDVQVVMPGGQIHVLDVTTAAQSGAGKVWKYDEPGTRGLTDVVW